MKSIHNNKFHFDQINLMVSENHFVKGSGRLRATVLEANNGIFSTTGLALGAEAARRVRDPIMTI